MAAHTEPTELSLYLYRGFCQTKMTKLQLQLLYTADVGERGCGLYGVRGAATQGAKGAPGGGAPRGQRLHEEGRECQGV